jgi:uncharacterized LabA/DUF88 family protein
MFEPKTAKIDGIANTCPKVISELNTLLEGRVNVYIDYANVRPWADKLGWHVDPKRLKQFYDSFPNVNSIKLYHGTLEGDERSEGEIADIQKFGYELITKPVKIMRFSIDTTSIANMEDKALLEQFVRRSLLRKFSGETIDFLNRKFAEMNKLGEFFIEDRKCNFDVEIGVDMLLEEGKNEFDTCVLWSGDSDFHDPLQRLLQNGKKVVLFATARRISKELGDLHSEGLIVFDIKKIKQFLCWNREMDKVLHIAKEPSAKEDSKL